MRLSQFQKRSVFVVLLCFTMVVVSFQNCSQVNFVELASQDVVDNTIQFRVHQINPTFSQVANDGAVKVLLVVDNSPTMMNSQSNLSKNLQTLLGEIKKYDASVKIISSSYYDSSCEGSNCRTKPSLARSRSNTSVTIEGHAGVGYYESLYDNSVNKVYSFQKNMTLADQDRIVDQIRSSVLELGTSGLDNESQFAAMAAQLDQGLSSFFKKGDKALIYILTDEDDSYSVSSLLVPVRSYAESANWSSSVPAAGYYYAGYTSPSGYCNYYNEAGQFTGSSSMSPMNFRNLQSCQDFVTSANSGNCNWMACQATRIYSNSGVIPLDGRTVAEVCPEVKALESLQMYNVEGCYESQITTYGGVSGNSYQTYLLGFTADKITASNSGAAREELVLGTVKAKLNELFGTKYLIGVSTNLKNQSCALRTGQTYDTFFTTRLNQYIPSSNLFVSSICDANTDDTALKRIASEFENVINNQYLIGLAANEVIEEVKVIIGEKEIILIENKDFVIEKDSFKLITKEIESFDKIEIKIKKI